MASNIYMVKKLSKDPIKFMEYVGSRADEFAGSCSAIKRLVCAAEKSTLNHPSFQQFLSVMLVKESKETLSNPPKNYWGSSMKISEEPISAISVCIPYIIPGAKSAIIDMLLQYHGNLHHYAKKRLLHICCNIVPKNDHRAVSIFKQFYRSVDRKCFEMLMNKIPGGTTHPEISTIVNKSKMFMHLKYENFDLSDLDNRRMLLKDLANSPTLCKKLPFTMTITKQDIEHLPAKTRFDFIRYLFDDKMRRHRHRTFASSPPSNKIDVDFIPLEDMKELLFPVMLHYNQEVNKWLDRYERFLN